MKQILVLSTLTKKRKTPGLTGVFVLLLNFTTFFNILTVVSHEITGQNAPIL